MTVPIKNILNNLFNAQNNWQMQLLNNWPTILGSIKAKVQLLKIHEDTLVLGVLDSCWLQELYLLTPLILQTINEKLDRPRIKKLRFKAIGTPDKKIKKEIPQKKTATKIIHLSPYEEQTLAQISDEQLRQVLREYLIRCYREKA